MKKRLGVLIVVGIVLVVVNSVFAQSGVPDNSDADNLATFSSWFKDVSFTSFVIGCLLMVWRDGQLTRRQLIDVLQRQADYNRAVLPPVSTRKWEDPLAQIERPASVFSAGDKKPS